VDGRIFKTMFAMLVILMLVFPLLNVYGFTAVKRKNYNATLTVEDPPDRPYIEIIKPANNSIYIRGFQVPIPFLGKMLCDRLSKLYDQEIYAISIGKKLTVKVDVKVLENESCEKVVFSTIIGDQYYIDDKPPYEYTFKVDKTTIYDITITAYWTNTAKQKFIWMHVSPSLPVLLRDAWKYFNSR